MITAKNKDCSGIEKEPLSNVRMCKEAAKEMKYKFRMAVTFPNSQKGCQVDKGGSTFWNNHKIGATTISKRAICRCKFPPNSHRNELFV